MSVWLPPPPPNAPTVLVVENARPVRTVAARMLAWEGYNVLTAKDGVEALAVMERQTVELILTDLKMPRLGGRELARRVAVRWPGVRMVFMTGHFELSLTDNLPGPLVLKPFTLEDLVDTVKSLLDPANRSAP